MELDRNKTKIIDQLLENKFNVDNLKEFCTKILNIPVKDRRPYDTIYKVFIDYIETYQEIAEYTDNDKSKIYVLAVKIKEEKDPVKARIKQREFIANILRERKKRGALVAFYNKNHNYWRISVIKLDYQFTVKGIKEDLTPAKRLSYVVGEGEACKTAKDQFYTLSSLKEDSVTLNQLEDIFALEKVTDKFFKEYKDKYLDIKETLIKDKVFMEEAKKHDIEKPESFAEGFAKKLMGQLAFLYFLQKKGWLGIQLAPDSLDYKEYIFIYDRALDDEKKVLDKIYERINVDTFILNKKALAKLDNKTESELLGRAFSSASYFKEWGTGEKNFIRNLYKTHKEEDINNDKTFFEDYLEILFYNNLSEDRGKIQYSTEFNSRIPFLNGGLFDPYGDYKWRETKFNLQDKLFSNDDGTGILDIFDKYNFTINENDSYETEVAVDPEMLGKVFENLLEVSDRKSKGAFYTPREIVRYMTNESIMNYLLTNLAEKEITKDDLEYVFNLGEFTKEYDQQIFEREFLGEKKPLKDEKGNSRLGMPRNIIIHSKLIDELLAKVKIADPACGSGAFPLGILNEIVRARYILQFYIHLLEFFIEKDEKKYWAKKNKSMYSLKLYTIQNCLYGVDIEPSAIDITKLRLWLSIIVDSSNYDVRPLPNLDFNFMIGNSLIDEFEGIKLFNDSLLNDEILEKELKKKKTYQQMSLLRGTEEIKADILKEIFSKQAKYFEEKNSQRKRLLKKEIEDSENSLIKFTLESNGQLEKLQEIEKGKKERRKPYFLWKLEFAKVFKENGGFDIILGNPPYVGEKGNKEKFRRIADTEFGRKYYLGKMDLFYFFYHLGLDILKEKGVLSFITTNYFFTADGAKKLREDLKERTNIITLINFNELKVFETAKGQHNAILLLIKEKRKEKICSVISNRNLNIQTKDISNFLYNNLENVDYYTTNQESLFGENGNIVLKSKESKIELILNKIAKEKKLSNICLINSGADVTISKIKDSHIKNFPGLKLNKNEGVFVISEKEIENLKLLDDEKYLIKDFIKNSDIKKYSFKLSLDKLIYLKWTDDITKYPNLKSHLLKFKDILIDQMIRYEEEYPWYALHRPREEKIFLGEKIIVPYRNKKNIFGYSNKPLYASRDVFFLNIIKDSLKIKYLLALLNSKLYYIWLYYKGKRKGEMLELYATPLKEIPIKVASSDEQEKYIQIVDRIMELKKLDKDTQELENQIDEMVYDLYDLTEEEKELVRNF
ncbi:Eco57I restriction-modification methylase domain-containing protein [Fusobacterium hominis]|uniref:Eco57I restriction-modification methylase domain-containing protein n=1 Tax=Fusobacterium hominis TaxID=2764326 RepID=UPI0022E8929B|nr:TaqI-like C-terminal specificity domain-containing protein [Fusobacterium hominis]